MKPQIIKTSLFGDLKFERVKTPAQIRKEKERAAFERSSEVFRAQFRAFAFEYMTNAAEFAAEDIAFAYSERRDLVQPTDFRCTGHFYSQLLEQRVIRILRRGKSKTRRAPIDVYAKAENFGNLQAD